MGGCEVDVEPKPRFSRSITLVLQGKHDEAKPLLERSVAIYEATFGVEHPHVVASLNDLAAILKKQVSVFLDVFVTQTFVSSSTG